MVETAKIQRILVVEDEPRLRKGVVLSIPAMGFVPVEASTGEEAIAIMQQKPCEVILLDLRLPGINGIDLLQIIRRRWPLTQVIITTGFGNLHLAQQAMQLDAVEFLTKPCTLNDLEKAIARACLRYMQALNAGTKPALQATSAQVEEATVKSTHASKALSDVERDHILAVLESNRGNRTVTAQVLGISRRTLHERLREYRQQGLIL